MYEQANSVRHSALASFYAANMSLDLGRLREQSESLTHLESAVEEYAPAGSSHACALMPTYHTHRHNIQHFYNPTLSRYNHVLRKGSAKDFTKDPSKTFPKVHVELTFATGLLVFQPDPIDST